MDKEWLELGIYYNPNSFRIETITDDILDLVNDDMNFHYFLEPNCELRFRVFDTQETLDEVREKVIDLARNCRIRGWTEREYDGEEDLYGESGYEEALSYFIMGSWIALNLNFKDARGVLTTPEPTWSPKHFHLNRYTHLLANQLGYSLFDEVKWAIRYTLNRILVWLRYGIFRESRP